MFNGYDVQLISSEVIDSGVLIMSYCSSTNWLFFRTHTQYLAVVEKEETNLAVHFIDQLIDLFLWKFDIL